MSEPVTPLRTAPASAPPPPDLRFGPAPGNTMSPPWAAHMLTLWFQAGDKRITFADAVRSTAVHFMVEGDT